MAEELDVKKTEVEVGKGSAGLKSQQAGQAATVDGMAAGTGGIGDGNFIERDLDQDLFEFESDDNPLMGLMLKAKKVSVKSPEVDHFMIDEERTEFATTAVVLASTAAEQFVLPAGDGKSLCKVCGTLLVSGVDGYTADGSVKTPGKDLMLYVTGKDATTSNPIVRAVNGPKTNVTDSYCTVPAIAKGTTIYVLANAMHETQRIVAPDSSNPVAQTVYLQKRGLTKIVSDYFDSQRKRIPFGQAILAERAIRKFKREGNRTLWIGRRGKMQVEDEKTGTQTVYFTEGVRWMFKKELQHLGKWTYEEFVAMAKVFYTGADVPSGAICLCGKNFLEGIQCIDFSKHPEVKIDVVTNNLGWKVTRIHTVFGDFEFKRDPTMDKIGLSNSCGIFGLDRLVHYERAAEHTEKDRVEGHEADRESVIAWDALALKGACHLFVNGEGTVNNTDSVDYVLWKEATAPTGDDLVSGTVYYMLNDCPAVNDKAMAGTMWLYTLVESTGTWTRYTEDIKV